jgi:hypothetical protein
VRARIVGSRGRPMQLNECETEMLASLLERSQSDPFSGRTGRGNFLTADDLAGLSLEIGDGGMDIDDDEAHISDESEELHHTAKPVTNMASTGPVLKVEQAIVAPNTTPHAEEDIPASVLASISVLQSSHELVEVSGPEDLPEPAHTDPHDHGSDQVDHEEPPPVEPPPVHAAPTEAELARAFSHISGGSILTETTPESSASTKDRHEHPGAAGYQDIMLKVRKGKRQSGSEPRKRRTITEADTRNMSPEAKAAHEKAQRMAAKL